MGVTKIIDEHCSFWQHSFHVTQFLQKKVDQVYTKLPLSGVLPAVVFRIPLTWNQLGLLTVGDCGWPPCTNLYPMSGTYYPTFSVRIAGQQTYPTLNYGWSYLVTYLGVEYEQHRNRDWFDRTEIWSVDFQLPPVRWILVAVKYWTSTTHWKLQCQS